MQNIFKSFFQRAKVSYLYRTHSFIEAYRRHTDLRVENNSENAIGGMWDEIGKLQFDFLKNEGLKPIHNLLDIGCGTLRGGRHFIRYLNPGNYTGLEISEKALEKATLLIKNQNLSEKVPQLIFSKYGDMRFDNIPSQYDYILAQSVFTHLPEEYIIECFQNLHKILRGSFYFTVFAGESSQSGRKNFSYPISWFQDVIEQNGFAFGDCSVKYPHPRGQIMLSAKNKIIPTNQDRDNSGGMK